MANDILKYLKEKEYVSGEVLAQKLGISRVAVWKQIQK
ncbi:MAG: HTH domain-containing protein, partial [Candidatus Atribacteria bacterium]